MPDAKTRRGFGAPVVWPLPFQTRKEHMPSCHCADRPLPGAVVPNEKLPRAASSSSEFGNGLTLWPPASRQKEATQGRFYPALLSSAPYAVTCADANRASGQNQKPPVEPFSSSHILLGLLQELVGCFFSLTFPLISAPRTVRHPLPRPCRAMFISAFASMTLSPASFPRRHRCSLIPSIRLLRHARRRRRTPNKYGVLAT